MLIDVECEDDTTQIAKIIQENTDTYVVSFLEKNSHHFYDFSGDTEIINKESVSGFYDVEELEDTGLYVKVPLGYELIDDSDDLDYECSDEEDEDEDDVSLDEEGEEE